MISHVKQQPMRDTDISVLIDKELEDTGDLLRYFIILFILEELQIAFTGGELW